MATKENQLLVDLKHNVGDFESNDSGDIKKIKGLLNLEQALFHRLLTVKGSLVHRPEYGIGIQSYQGQLMNVDRQRNLALNIKEQFLMDDRVISVDQVQFVFDNFTPDLFQVFVKYTPIGYNVTDSNFDPFELGA